ncbi:glycosyltransferase family 1 protein [Multifurca ochricompacta]|uniref:sterol 3beta-glucosyltransferase n=1 Tax=Multifurca ochricompacta TaxID=376703 RepID=A0AAD4QU09_9AGAM|nr:glycosyltransferase family 1 protein [Multifurca ochricompacta]
MRAGTQTLIQALQALPLVDDPEIDDELMNHDLSLTESDSDDEGKPATTLASSIHTIYRPVARFRRQDSSHILSAIDSTPGDHAHPSSGQEQLQKVMTSDEDTDADDFELPKPVTTSRRFSKKDRPTALSPVLEHASPKFDLRHHAERSGSLSTVKTVKLNRRARLAEKLAEVFDINGINEVIAEMPCWLMRSVLLQGYMYLTNSYLCFFAHMPSREDQVLKSGSLHKKAQRTKRWIKHWFILKNDALSWYQSSSDPYFPRGMVDLRYAIACDPYQEKDIRLRTNTKTIYLCADSVPSRSEWVKAIRRVIFKAQNMGDSVKIAIPYSTIIDVDKSSALDFRETIEVKVVDGSEDLAVDSYFFTYFHDISAALEQIRDAIASTRRFVPEAQESPNTEQLIDTTVLRSTSTSRAGTSEQPTYPEPAPKSSSPFRLSALLRPFQDLPLGRAAIALGQPDEHEEFTHVEKRDNSSFVPIACPPTPSDCSGTSHANELSQSPLTLKSRLFDNVSPTSQEHSLASSWVSVPSWLRVSRRNAGSAAGAVSQQSAMQRDGKSVTEVYSSGVQQSMGSSHGPELGYSVLDAPDFAVDTEMIEKFQTSFAFDDKERLLGYFPGYLFRVLPVFGRLFISCNYLCFKSSGTLTSKTRMILPIRDILSTETSKAFRFGHYGLVVIVKGHEELFLEFSQLDRRTAFISVLEKQIEDVRRRQVEAEPVAPTLGKRDALLLEELGIHASFREDVDPRPPPENMSDSVPAVMFTSTSSTFLTFKPERSLHFTFLTIGSRGDVQPYIALAKGLLAEGHRVRIATHGEFKSWIESHGIEFGYVGGDPAELMRICVENGTFTIAFLKEGVMKFRGWIDDLLKTSWEACQGTDVLVESPSAMAGYHIAEALRIPYFRAFTMTWSRTRAYPHAFAVPEHKMGGSYNYMTYVMFDQVFWRGTAGQINRWRRNTLGLPSTSLDKMEPHKIPFLYNFSPTVVPAPLDWPEWIRITGYWFLDDADVGSKKWEPPTDLINFIDNARKLKKKLVYIGFGSIVVSDPKGMTRTVVNSIVQSGVHAILSRGWSDRLSKNTSEATEPEEPLPQQIYSISSVPHDWLFKQIDAACHHGGAGTTGASLRAGIPTIIRPFFGDQFFWADRVEALGVGTSVRKLTVENLAEALIAATTDQRQIARAKLVGEQIRSENGVATAIEAIYRDLEYSRTLIKRSGAPDERTGEGNDAEDATIREKAAPSSPPSRSETRSGGSSAGGGPPSEDWSVVSDPDDLHSSVGSSLNGKGAKLSKRNSLTAAMLSVLPDALTSSGHRRPHSVSSVSGSPP